MPPVPPWLQLCSPASVLPASPLVSLPASRPRGPAPVLSATTSQPHTSLMAWRLLECWELQVSTPSCHPRGSEASEELGMLAAGTDRLLTSVSRARACPFSHPFLHPLLVMRTWLPPEPSAQPSPPLLGKVQIGYFCPQTVGQSPAPLVLKVSPRCFHSLEQDLAKDGPWAKWGPYLFL